MSGLSHLEMSAFGGGYGGLVTMSDKELDRLRVLERVISGALTQRTAADLGARVSSNVHRAELRPLHDAEMYARVEAVRVNAVPRASPRAEGGHRFAFR
jgi:hypothetical protein